MDDAERLHTAYCPRCQSHTLHCSRGAVCACQRCGHFVDATPPDNRDAYRLMECQDGPPVDEVAP